MNQTIKEIFERVSVRSYLNQPIEEKEKNLILEAAIQAPTGGNMTLYSMIDVVDQDLKDKLANSCDHQPFIATAPFVLIFLADYQRWYDTFLLKEKDVRLPGTGDLFLSMADAMIAAQNAVNAAWSLGIGSCYIGDIIEEFEYHQELLKLPQYVVPVGMVCFGYPTPQQASRKKPPRFKISDVVHTDYYQQTSAKRLEEMLEEKQNLSGQKLDEWIKAFCKRKWNSDFSVEMSRSVDAIIASWNQTNEKE